MSYLFITSAKNKRNTFHVSSLSTKWFHITLPSCCCNQNCAQTFPLLHVLCREVSSAVCWVLENYHPSCSSAQAHSLGLWTSIKLWGFYPIHNPPRLSFCLARLSLFLGRNNRPISRWIDSLGLCCPALLSPWAQICLSAGGRTKTPHSKEVLSNLQSRVASVLRHNTWCSSGCYFQLHAGSPARVLTEQLDFVSAPTAVPTVSEGKPVDECDDDQANCHSGTGDDYQLTGAETILIPLQLHCSSYPSPA